MLLLAIGFVAALVFSWVFDLTPEGLKRDAEVDPTRSIALRTAQRMDRRESACGKTGDRVAPFLRGLPPY